jgi:hypothetical protein
MNRLTRSRRMLLIAFGLTLMTGVASIAADFHFGPRQYYGAWRRHPQRAYHYRHYYYKPRANFSGYRHHYVVHFHSRPQHHYFYNPYSKRYWGRCPVKQGEEPKYSLLAEKDRKATVKDIPESAFPEPGELPGVPEATDDAKLDLPPDDLPEEETPDE